MFAVKSPRLAVRDGAHDDRTPLVLESLRSVRWPARTRRPALGPSCLQAEPGADQLPKYVDADLGQDLPDVPQNGPPLGVLLRAQEVPLSAMARLNLRGGASWRPPGGQTRRSGKADEA